MVEELIEYRELSIYLHNSIVYPNLADHRMNPSYYSAYQYFTAITFAEGIIMHNEDL